MTIVYLLAKFHSVWPNGHGEYWIGTCPACGMPQVYSIELPDPTYKFTAKPQCDCLLVYKVVCEKE